MSMLFGPDGHLTVQTAALLRDGALNERERLAAAAHLASCGLCATLVAACAERSPVRPPAGFSGLVLTRALNERRQERRQFRLYAARVCVSVCAALALTFSGLLNLPARGSLLSDSVRSGSDFVENISRGFQSFSESILSLEEQIHENKAK